ncbi:hypothetical protein Scep_013053 [Stephania cephalantha]|uniref:Uncharacterized protein n=1 Tax=Stephania cephalantha TaxID=152367 RepID=A0AAP0PA81_9MAGN
MQARWASQATGGERPSKPKKAVGWLQSAAASAAQRRVTTSRGSESVGARATHGSVVRRRRCVGRRTAELTDGVGGLQDDSKRRGRRSSPAADVGSNKRDGRGSTTAATRIQNGARREAAKRRSGGVVNGVEQRRGGTLPDRSIPDETTTVDNVSRLRRSSTTRRVARE